MAQVEYSSSPPSPHSNHQDAVVTHLQPVPATADNNDVAVVTPMVDLLAGGIAGTASVVVGHPFDTVKVRMQLQSGSGIGSPASWYRGITAPLSTAAAVNALVFASFGWSSRIWDDVYTNNDKYVLDDKNNNGLWKNLVCGSFAGLVNCLVICPMEHVKCRLQIQECNSSIPKNKIVHATTHSKPSPASAICYRGTIHATSHILTTQGVSGLFRGWHATCWREIPAFGLYFTIYDVIRDSILLGNTHERQTQPWVASALAGGCSGSFTWAMVYPVDVIKSKIQTTPLNSTKPEHRKIWHVGRQMVRERGIRSMFRGLGVTVVRAFPVNGIIFPVYEFTVEQLTTK